MPDVGWLSRAVDGVQAAVVAVVVAAGPVATVAVAVAVRALLPTTGSH